jgi:hypothetical protein
MQKHIIIILTVLLFASKINAQLFVPQEFYPGIKTVKGKYYSGSGGGGYWSIAKLDTLGRTTEEESYRKKELLGRNNYVYNSNNDQLYYIVTFNLNRPNQIDTISNYEYRYQGNRIVHQKDAHRSHRDSTVIQLIENKGDTILIYQHKSYYFRPKTNATAVFERRYTLNYQNDLLVLSEMFDLNENSKETTHFEYFANGMLKRRKIEREPEPEDKVNYVGGPGSDDEFYKYKFDKSGRIKTFYRIIGKKKYKIATYEYDKK